MTKYQRCSAAQTVRINDILKDHLEKVGHDDAGAALFRYHPAGYCERDVAETVGCSPSSVAHVRKEIFGHLSKPPAPQSAGARATEIAGLADRVERLEKLVRRLLIDLGIEQIYDETGRALFTDPDRFTRVTGRTNGAGPAAGPAAGAPTTPPADG